MAVINFRSQAKFDKGISVVLVPSDHVRSKHYNFSHRELSAIVNSLSSNRQFTGADGELFPVSLKKNLVLLAGIGELKKLDGTGLRTTLRKAFLSGFVKKQKDIEIIPHDSTESTIKAVIEGYVIGTYGWKKYMTPPIEEKQTKEKHVVIVAPAKAGYAQMVAVCEGVTLARDLVNDNADVVTSTHIESVIRKLIQGHKNAKLEVLNKRELTQKGLDLHLAVNKGSQKEPKLIIVKYTGDPSRQNYTAVVGKGMTFDTGGLNLKPTGHIETMRTDMSGAAAVVGALKNVVSLRLKKNIIFAVGIAENAIGSRAYKPGDVYKGYGGKTVEIGNTDAEGRLVLADAIAYLVKNYKPARIIDIATLTGACVVALGYDYCGLVSNNDDFAREVIHASNESDDRAWRLPSYPQMKEYIKSQYADIKNVGLGKGAAGTLTAAEFLRQFTQDTPWVHLDIAGTAYVESAGRLYYGFGATGFGVRLLTEYLKEN